VTLPYEYFRAQDTGAYLKNTGTYAEQLAAKDAWYEHISAKSLDDMVAQLNSRLAPGDTIKELVIATHGTRSGTFLLPTQEGQYQSPDTLKSAVRRLGPTLADLQQRMAGANITLHACEVGNAKEALKDLGRFFGAKGGEVAAPRPFVQFYKRNQDGVVILRLDADLTPGGEWLMDSKKGKESMTRVRITDEPMSTEPEIKVPGAGVGARPRTPACGRPTRRHRPSRAPTRTRWSTRAASATPAAIGWSNPPVRAATAGGRGCAVKAELGSGRWDGVDRLLPDRDVLVTVAGEGLPRPGGPALAQA
jgi:hypothetical protein